jgi:YidC/Oxa1 family membrane protein insertase
LGNLFGTIWKVIAVQPIINLLLVLSHYLFNNFGLGLIALTILSKAILYPLTLKQMKTTRAMQEMQPKLYELQRKYGRDKQRLAREQMALYKDAGASPVGCAVPLLIQLPIMIALYNAITRILAAYPEDFLGLSQYLYPISIVYAKLPLESTFLWLNLSLPDQFYILPVLTGLTMWAQQKQITVTAPDPQQESQQRIMQWSMPLVFTVFSLSFPSGLAIYWVLSNIVTMITQYFTTGWGGLADLKNTRIRLPWGGIPAKKPVKRPAKIELSSSKATSITNVNPENSTELPEGEPTGDSTQENLGEPGKSPGKTSPRLNPRKYKSRRSRGK